MKSALLGKNILWTAFSISAVLALCGCETTAKDGTSSMAGLGIHYMQDNRGETDTKMDPNVVAALQKTVSDLVGQVGGIKDVATAANALAGVASTVASDAKNSAADAKAVAGSAKDAATGASTSAALAQKDATDAKAGAANASAAASDVQKAASANSEKVAQVSTQVNGLSNQVTQQQAQTTAAIKDAKDQAANSASSSTTTAVGGALAAAAAGIGAAKTGKSRSAGDIAALQQQVAKHDAQLNSISNGNGGGKTSS